MMTDCRMMISYGAAWLLGLDGRRVCPPHGPSRSFEASTCVRHLEAQNGICFKRQIVECGCSDDVGILHEGSARYSKQSAALFANSKSDAGFYSLIHHFSERGKRTELDLLCFAFLHESDAFYDKVYGGFNIHGCGRRCQYEWRVGTFRIIYSARLNIQYFFLCTHFFFLLLLYFLDDYLNLISFLDNAGEFLSLVVA